MQVQNIILKPQWFLCVSCAVQKDEVYLNLVLDFVPETVYRVARHFNKAKSIIPIIYVKVGFLLIPQRHFWPFLSRHFYTILMCRPSVVASSGLHVPVVSQPGLHPFPGRVSQRHQAPKPACRPWNGHPQAVWLWQVSWMDHTRLCVCDVTIPNVVVILCWNLCVWFYLTLQRQAAGPWRTQRVVYLLSVLSRPRAHFWRHRLHGKHWHLVGGLCSGWAAAGTAHIPRWQWGGSARRDHQGESLYQVSLLVWCIRIWATMMCWLIE